MRLGFARPALQSRQADICEQPSCRQKDNHHLWDVTAKINRTEAITTKAHGKKPRKNMISLNSSQNPSKLKPSQRVPLPSASSQQCTTCFLSVPALHKQLGNLHININMHPPTLRLLNCLLTNLPHLFLPKSQGLRDQRHSISLSQESSVIKSPPSSTLITPPPPRRTTHFQSGFHQSGTNSPNPFQL